MKTTFKTAAQSMMLLAACVAAVAQKELVAADSAAVSPTPGRAAQSRV